MKNVGITSLVILLSYFLVSCHSGHNPVNDFVDPNGGGGASGRRGATAGPSKEYFTNTLVPVMKTKCFTCHGAGAKIGKKDVDWTKYENLAASKERLRGLISLIENDAMPPGGGLGREEKDKFISWAQSGLGSTPNPTPTPTPGPVPPEDLGKEAYQVRCAVCHDNMPSNPVIFGQPKKYLIAEMEKYREGTREDHMMYNSMNFIAEQIGKSLVVAISDYLEKNPEEACALDYDQEPGGGDITNGEKLVADKFCMTCHETGNAMNAPEIRRQRREYLVHTMRAFKIPAGEEGHRPSAVMNGQVETLSDQDIDDIAAYLNSLDHGCPQEPKPDPIAEGKKLVEAKGCMGCHAEGNAFGAPEIRYRKDSSIKDGLIAFRLPPGEPGHRASPFMNPQATGLSDEEIEFISVYLNSLEKK